MTPEFKRFKTAATVTSKYEGVYPKVSGLAALREKRKWYGSLPLGAVVLLFCESVQ
jgi:hypothetical protein